MLINQTLLNPLIHQYDLGNESLNQKLENHVRQEIAKTKGLDTEKKHSNIGGWHSERDLDLKLGDHSLGSGYLLKLFDSFSPAITQYIQAHTEKFHTTQKKAYEWNYAGAWYNVAFGGSYNAPHIHPYCQISGAYYIRTEEPSKTHPLSGRIDFIDETIQYGFFPKAGTLFLFPSDMLHFVHPYHGSDLRICLSFNLKNIR